MKRVVRACVVVVFVAAVFASQGCDGTTRLKDDDNGASVTLVTGDTLELVLTSNPTTGYSWSVVEVPACLEQDGEPEYDSDAPPFMMGAGGEDTWRFVAVEPGEGTLRLEYARPWESDERAPVEVYEIEVTVE